MVRFLLKSPRESKTLGVRFLRPAYRSECSCHDTWYLHLECITPNGRYHIKLPHPNIVACQVSYSMPRTHKPTLDLLNSPLFARRQLTPVESAQRSYERAKAIGLAHSTLSYVVLYLMLTRRSTELSIADVAQLSDKYWDMHRDYMLLADGAAATLLTIQYNLVAGTLTQYLAERRDLEPLLQDILSWKVQYVHCFLVQNIIILVPITARSFALRSLATAWILPT
jgi:hypothetical protein